MCNPSLPPFIGAIATPATIQARHGGFNPARIERNSAAPTWTWTRSVVEAMLAARVPRSGTVRYWVADLETVARNAAIRYFQRKWTNTRPELCGSFSTRW
jgi:hypothetical protein